MRCLNFVYLLKNLETLDILDDEKLMKSIKAGEKDIQENRLITFKELLVELKIYEEEI